VDAALPLIHRHAHQHSIDFAAVLLPCAWTLTAQKPANTLVAQDAVLQRCFAAEPVFALAASADGCHVAGGGASGHVYLWQAASGRLLRSWPAHYKVCTAVLDLGSVSGVTENVAAGYV